MNKINLPHNELVIGMTGSGKTHYLTKHLESIVKDNPSLKKVFIICPTIKHNRTFNEWGLGKSSVICFIGCHQNSVNAELREIHGRCQTKEFLGSDKDFKTLVVLDDCASGQDVKGQTSDLVEISMNGRHVGMGIIVLTQQLTSIAKAYRDQTTRIVSFYNCSKKDSKLLFDDHMGDISKKEAEKIQLELKNGNYKRLEITKVPKHKWEIK